MSESYPPIGRRKRAFRLAMALTCAMLLAAGGGVCVWLINRGESKSTDSHASQNPQDLTKRDQEELQSQITAFCGACHAPPVPQSFPRSAWHDEVRQGFDFYFESQRTDLFAPPPADVVDFYRSLAPNELILPPIDQQPSTVLKFRRESVMVPGGNVAPAVSNIRWVPPDSDSPGELLFCDMKLGDVRRLRLGSPRPTPTLLGKFASPAHVEPINLDGDQRRGYVVSVLGSFLPADHSHGQVAWVRPRSSGGNASADFEPVVLDEKLGRVADVQSADFDQDGDLDLVVAEFGWRKSGRLLLLKQTGSDGSGKPQFERHILDPRHGAIHVPVADLNADGKPDFVALISQEHEVIDAFLGNGDGTFRTERIFAAGDPAFGSSGIQLIDLDGDGDLDVLYTNGDSLDGKYLKPYHAIYWLENRGQYPFTPHKLTTMPGVFRALAADLDGDGDLDVVACAYIPPTLKHAASPQAVDRLIWLEQVRPGEFVRHSLGSTSIDGYVALETGDFDADGDIDIAVGNFTSAAQERPEWLTLWWNLRTP